VQLIDDASKVWHRLWSVRLSAIAVVASAFDAGWEVHVTGQPPILALATAAISAGAGFARLVAQPKLHGDSNG
jgi:hypothetical protein